MATAATPPEPEAGSRRSRFSRAGLLPDWPEAFRWRSPAGLLALGLGLGFGLGVVMTAGAGLVLLERHGPLRTGLLATLEERLEQGRGEVMACRNALEERVQRLSDSLGACEAGQAAAQQSCLAGREQIENDFLRYRHLIGEEDGGYNASPEIRKLLAMFPLRFSAVVGQTVGLESLLRFKLENVAGKEIYLRVLPSEDGVLNVQDGESFHVSRGDLLFTVKIARQGREHLIELHLDSTPNRGFTLPVLSDLLCRAPAERVLLPAILGKSGK